MIIGEFQEQVDAYASGLERFISEHDLPDHWFDVPDHIAVKGADGPDFDRLVSEFRPMSTQISCIDMDGRRLATATLLEPLAVGSFGAVGLLEIMEPRPEKVGTDVVGLEHMEFYHPYFEEVETTLNDRNIPYEREQNPSHSWLNIVLNDEGQEVKLNDKPLQQTVAKDLQDGSAYFL